MTSPTLTDQLPDEEPILGEIPDRDFREGLAIGLAVARRAVEKKRCIPRLEDLDERSGVS